MSTRRSTRLKSKPAIAFTGLEPDTTIDEDAEFAEYNLSDSDELDSQPSRRKPKKTGASSLNGGRDTKNTKHVKGRRGRLRALPYVQAVLPLLSPQNLTHGGYTAEKCH
jgi:hypothetical protein